MENKILKICSSLAEAEKYEEIWRDTHNIEEYSDYFFVIEETDDKPTKFEVWLKKDNAKSISFYFDFNHTFYEPCKKMISILKKEVPDLEWEKSDEELKEGEEIQQFHLATFLGYIKRDKNTFLLMFHKRYDDESNDIAVGLMSKKNSDKFKRIVESSNEMVSSIIQIEVSTGKTKKNGNIILTDYDYELIYTYWYK